MTNATLAAQGRAPGSVLPDGVPKDAWQNAAPLTALLPIPEVERLIDGFVMSWHSSAASIQSRRWHRVPFRKPVLITPLNASTETPSGVSFEAMGRDISLQGISFVHEDPLAERKVAITIPIPGSDPVSVVALLRWCRFGRDGHYQSGGQFLRSAALPEFSAPACLMESIRAF